MIFIIDSPKYGKHEVHTDDEDWNKIKDIKWHIARKKNSKTAYVYCHLKINGKYTSTTLHKYLTGYKITDHMDCNGLNCKRNNMRECSRKENTRNTGMIKTNTSGYKGVRIIKNKYIIAQIRVNGFLKYLGTFKTKDQAAIAYNIEALKCFGEFANLNNIMKDNRYECI